MRVRHLAAVGSGAAVGFALRRGAHAFAARGRPDPAGRREHLAGRAPFTVPEAPDIFLAWASGGFASGFREDLAAAPGFERTVVVASDNTWLTRSFDDQGETVDDPPPGFAIPLEVGAVNPREFAPFLPPADRGVTLALADGQGVLGESSAKLRGLGPGAVLRFGHVDVTVAAILPDELVGAHELLVSREVGRRIGVTHDRYALLQPQGHPTDRELEKQIRAILPAGALVRVRAPGETPYFRQGDAVLPPVRLKMLFGEFAAMPTPGQPGYLTLDPAWVRDHIATERVPLLGSVTCNVAAVPADPRGDPGADRRRPRRHHHELLGLLLTPVREPEPGGGDLTPHVGVALDINVPQNPFEAEPDQNPRMVAVFERWGFIWVGRSSFPTACISSTDAHLHRADAGADKREGSSEHALSALARGPAAMPPSPRACLPRQDARGFLLPSR